MTVVLVGMVSGSVAFADPTETNVAHGYIPKNFSLQASVVRTNSLYSNQDGNDYQAMDYMLTPVFPLSKDYTLSAFVDFNQNLATDRADYGFDSISLTKASGYELFGNSIKMIPRLGAFYPLDQGSIASSLQAEARVGSRFDVNPDVLFSKHFGLAFDVSGARDFHRYTTSIRGDVNTEWLSTQTIELTWAFTDNLSAIGALTHWNMWTYDGYASDAFSHVEELDYQVSKKWIVSVGHEWGLPFVGTLGPNGHDFYFAGVDNWNSLVYAQVTFVL